MYPRVLHLTQPHPDTQPGLCTPAVTACRPHASEDYIRRSWAACWQSLLPSSANSPAAAVAQSHRQHRSHRQQVQLLCQRQQVQLVSGSVLIPSTEKGLLLMPERRAFFVPRGHLQQLPELVRLRRGGVWWCCLARHTPALGLWQAQCTHAVCRPGPLSCARPRAGASAQPSSSLAAGPACTNNTPNPPSPAGAGMRRTPASHILWRHAHTFCPLHHCPHPRHRPCRLPPRSTSPSLHY